MFNKWTDFVLWRYFGDQVPKCFGPKLGKNILYLLFYLFWYYKFIYLEVVFEIT